MNCELLAVGALAVFNFQLNKKLYTLNTTLIACFDEKFFLILYNHEMDCT